MQQLIVFCLGNFFHPDLKYYIGSFHFNTKQVTKKCNLL